MAATHDKTIHVEAARSEKIQTTYRYVPLIGEILGFWRAIDSQKMGEEIVLHIKTPLYYYDRVYINGEEIQCKKQDI